MPEILALELEFIFGVFMIAASMLLRLIFTRLGMFLNKEQIQEIIEKTLRDRGL